MQEKANQCRRFPQNTTSHDTSDYIFFRTVIVGRDMTTDDTEIPTNRCGFELHPEIGIPRTSPWEIEISAVCCWRLVWESHDETDRCIWHADVDEKPLVELIETRADIPERLDGAILRHRHVEWEALSLGDCPLLGAIFDNSMLEEVDFTNTDLRGATFTGADLQEANFTNAELAGADFTDADLRGATFTDAEPVFTDFIDAELADAVFTNAISIYADFTDACLPRAKFTGTDLSAAIFIDAELLNADFRDAVPHGANFTGADLRRVNFTDAGLRDADLSDANLKMANFRHATLEDAVLTRADCRRTTFTSALLYETVFADTRINSNTTFFDPKMTFYDSITSRPGCVYEENSLTVHPLSKDIPITDYLPKTVHPLAAARWVYRRLETLHEENALSEAAREFHISKEEADRSLYWKRGEYGPWAVKTLMWYLTRHGESVKRVLTWWAGVILSAGLLFAGLGGVKDATGTDYAITSLSQLRTVAGWQDILMNIYFSVTTFSTIMDGELAPVGPWSRAVVAVESLAGIVLTALFVFILGRRTAR